MPLTSKGRKVMGSMKEQYGKEKGEKVFYASRNKGRIKGVDKATFRRTIGDALSKGVPISDALSAGVVAATNTHDAARARRGTFFRNVRDGALKGSMTAADVIKDALSRSGPFVNARYARDYGVPGMKKGVHSQAPTTTAVAGKRQHLGATREGDRPGFHNGQMVQRGRVIGSTAEKNRTEFHKGRVYQY